MRRASVGMLLCWPAFLPAACAAARGQQTMVSQAGGGRKIESVYNDAHQVVETRTLDAEGRLEQRVEYEYRPGFQVPQQLTTSYWPDGKTARRKSRVEYDENANFTLQVDSLFDASGKQTAGNKLIHDPLTGIYRCYRWVGSADFNPEACPKPEEESSGEEAKELTRAEVLHDLAEARQTLRNREKVRRLGPMTPIRPPITGSAREIGIVLPAALHPGELVSGRVVEDPADYGSKPGLQLIRIKVPFESEGSASTLAGWSIAVANGVPRQADGPVTFTVPRGATELTVTLRQKGNPAHAVSGTVAIEKSPAQRAPGAQAGFEASPICFKGGLCPVRGRFSGDSAQLLAAFGNQLAPIEAETEEVAYIAVPDSLPTGLTHLLVAEGPRAAVFPVDVAQFELTPTGRELKRGQTLVMHAILSGAEDLPDGLWRAGVFDLLASPREAQRLAPDFELPGSAKQGLILAVVHNDSPDAVAMRAAKDQTFAFELTPDSFERGEFKFNFVLEFLKDGGYSLRGTALPFLAPVKGREIALTTKANASHAGAAR